MTPLDTAIAGKQSLLRRVASWAARGGLAGIIIWLSLWSLQGITALVRPVETVQADTKPELNPLELVQAHDLTGGAWQFLDDTGDISAESLSPADSERRMLAPPKVASVNAGGLKGRFQDILQIMRQQGKVQSVGKLWRYSLKQMGFHVVAFTRDQSGRDLISIRWLIPLGDDKYWLIEQTPASTSSEERITTESIIPKSLRAKILAERTDGAGQRFCQLVRVDSSLADLLDQWRREGWQIEAPPGEARPGFATISLSRQHEFYWMLASLNPDAKSLRVLLLKERVSSGSPVENSSLDDER